MFFSLIIGNNVHKFLFSSFNCYSKFTLLIYSIPYVEHALIFETLFHPWLTFMHSTALLILNAHLLLHISATNTPPIKCLSL